MKILYSALCCSLLSSACQLGPRPERVSSSRVRVSVDYETDTVLPYANAPLGPWYPEATYDDSLPTPDACLGYPVGSRMADGEAVIECFRQWAQQSPRVRVERYARSYEGRELVRVIISSKENLENLETILSDINKLAEPEGIAASDLRAVVRRSPAIGWFGYSIHGDETSGVDASIIFGHYLIAGTDQRAEKIRRNVVVVIDPVMNPDGRARFLGLVEQSRSLVPNSDYASMHRGAWPLGRGNHYLFDLNRDWISGTQPETRGRWANFLRFHPQLFVDAHEMWSTETYLFSPKGRPINPNYPAAKQKWNQLFAQDQSAAFDRNGWTYYTREWSDNWYPGYASTWSPLQGAVGILYEQARYAGQDTLRPSGEVATYRDAVHHHAVSSMANVVTLERHRADILNDYLRFHQASLRGRGRSFVLVPGQHPSREHELVSLLIEQGIRIHRLERAIRVHNAVSSLGKEQTTLVVPEGSYVVPGGQAKGALAHALLDFDPHFGQADLEAERRLLVSRGRGKMYDVTSWNLAMAYAVEAYWVDTPVVEVPRLVQLPAVRGKLRSAREPAVAWVVDSRDDRALIFAVRAMERGIAVHASDKSFYAGGRSFARGSLLIRGVENGPDASSRVAQLAEEARVEVVAVASHRSATDGPDLGGRHFRMLSRPRVAVLTNQPVSASDYGHIWYWLDRRLHLPITRVDVQHLSRYDLRRYNVLIVPPMRGPMPTTLRAAVEELRTWVEAGGTLIAMGASASWLSSPETGLTAVRRRRDVLSSLELYRAGVQRWFDALDIEVDAVSIWREQKVAPAGLAEAALAKSAEPRQDPDAEMARASEDAWLRRFSPGGTVLRSMTDPAHWLTSGVGRELPVLVQGDLALMAPESVRVPVRLAPASELRLSGLLWPEARRRLAATAWATVERVGMGQIVLFAGQPGFRSQQLGTGRLFSNAIVLGPGLGAEPPYPR